MNIYKEVINARDRIKPFIKITDAEYSPYLSKITRGDIYLKLENTQYSGSFKLRGACNKILSLNEEEKSRGLITASSGNHGAAFAFMVDKLGLKGTIYLPENASKAKIEALNQYKIDLELFGSDTIETELHAINIAEASGKTFISPYNDPKVIGGQGTIGLELSDQVKELDAVFVPVGGGGLVAGIAGFLKEVNPKITIIGCQPLNSPVMYESIKAGRIIEMESLPTLADGSAGGIEPGSITFEPCRDLVDHYVILSEDEIAASLKLMIEKHCILMEGASAMSVAALLREKDHYENKKVALVITGKKITIENLKLVISI